MTCKICETRRPRRFCPGVRGDICPVCCGTEREVTVSCPLDCEYLQHARKHERPPEINPKQLPNRDIRLSEEFLVANQPLLVLMSRALLEAARETPGTVDSDVREALESLIRTYRTLESGLVYETRPTNPLAANIHQRVQQLLTEQRQRLQERLGIATIRDADVLGVLVFLQRIEYQRNNGRRRGRAFLGFLHTNFPAVRSPLIVA